MPKLGEPSIGVDAGGAPVIDPTENVKALSEAANKRQDDLREANALRFKDRIEELDAIIKLRAYYGEELAKVHAACAHDLHQSERASIQLGLDKVERSLQNGLDKVERSLQTALDAAERRLNEKVNPLDNRISELEKSSYKGAGRQLISDPMMAELLTKVESLRLSSASGSGREEGIKLSWGALIGAGTLVAAVAAVFTSFIRVPAPVSPSPPQVYYAPAAPGTLVPQQAPPSRQ